jgi:hypothetical protein
MSSHVPYVRDEPKDDKPNYARVANIGLATIFSGYRTFLGWTGLVFIGLAVLFLNIAPLLETEVDDTVIREQQVKGAAHDICRKSYFNTYGACRVNPEIIEQARRRVAIEMPKRRSGPGAMLMLFSGLIGAGILLGLWLPATLAAKAIDKLDEKNG